ncbi:MAG: fumarate reductase cytochrome b subunit [Campylobacterales bacterium]|nr:fumarate reductase cytochrome b subunit [Campylobacterales bacterium]
MDRRERIGKTPARLDFLQSFTGIALALFISFHLLFESSILISKEAMYTLTQFFEGYYFFGQKYPLIISALAAFILLLIVVHASVALRKFPASYRQYRAFKTHMTRMNHHDTSLWAIQVSTGFAMFFLASIHLYTMITLPDQIGPYASSERIALDMMWPMYLLLLFAVVVHAGIGVYRLILKWGFFEPKNPKALHTRRALLRSIMYFVITFYLVLGVASLGRYMVIGYSGEFAPGERYHPQGAAQ